MSPGVRRIVAPIVGIVAFAVFWELLVRLFDIRRFVLLPPSAIIDTLTSAPGFFWDNALVTARHMVVGLSIALLFAIAVGSLMAGFHGDGLTSGNPLHQFGQIGNCFVGK